MKKLIISIVISLLLTGCVKDVLTNTSHPELSALEVTIEFEEGNFSSDAVLPQDFTLCVDGEVEDAENRTHLYSQLLTPGDHSVLVYHVGEGVTASAVPSENSAQACRKSTRHRGVTASAVPSENSVFATIDTLEDGTINPLPDYFFSGSTMVPSKKDDTLHVEIPIHQHIRSLTLVLKFEGGGDESIHSVDATLSGIADRLNLLTGSISNYSGRLMKPRFSLTTIPSSTRAEGIPAVVATLHLLGIASVVEPPIITLLLNGDHEIETDMGFLDRLNKGYEPLMLEATISLPSEAGVSATISDWTVIENVDINLY